MSKLWFLKALFCQSSWDCVQSHCSSASSSHRRHTSKHSLLIVCQLQQNKKCVWSRSVLTILVAVAHWPTLLLRPVWCCFSFLVALNSDFSRVSFRCQHYKEDSTKTSFSFFRSHVFLFIMVKKERRQNKEALRPESCPADVVYLWRIDRLLRPAHGTQASHSVRLASSDQELTAAHRLACNHFRPSSFSGWFCSFRGRSCLKVV